MIFKRSTVFKWLTPNDKLATYGLDDPEVDGVACHLTVPERGGIKGWLGVAEEYPISLASRQIGPIRFKAKFEQGDDVFRRRRSFFFKKMQIVRGCDIKRNVLVYMVYSDRIIEGSPKNSQSSVPIMPWGGGDTVAKCSDWVQKTMTRDASKLFSVVGRAGERRSASPGSCDPAMVRLDVILRMASGLPHIRALNLVVVALFRGGRCEIKRSHRESAGQSQGKATFSRIRASPLSGVRLPVLPLPLPMFR